jgi:hypothetical protein
MSKFQQACRDLAPRGASALRCECGRHLLKKSEPVILALEGVFCPACSKRYSHPCHPVTTVLETSAYALTKQGVRSATWLHATWGEEWDQLASRRPAAMVHIGTKNAAMHDRIARDVWSPFYVFEVRLRTRTPVADEIFADVDDWTVEWPKSSKRLPKAMVNGANRYVNSWEAPGSISLLVPAGHLRVTKVRRVEREPRWSGLNVEQDITAFG